MGIRLTPREFDLLVCLDKSEKGICEELEIGVNGYKALYKRLAKKLNAHTRSAIIIKALKLGLVRLQHFESYYS